MMMMKRRKEPEADSEDDADDTIKPRLEALSANMDKIFILDGIKKKGFSNNEESFGLSRDLDVLNQMIEEIHGASMVIIDPVNGYLDDVDSYNNSEVRRLLTPLSLLASRHKTSVIMVSNQQKPKVLRQSIKFQEVLLLLQQLVRDS